MLLLRLATAVLALSAAACVSREPPRVVSAPVTIDLTAEAALRGQQLAARTCAACHAVGSVGASPMAEATPFRDVARLYPLDQLETAFAEGLVTSHPAMPAFAFRASEIDDLMAYLEGLRAER